MFNNHEIQPYVVQTNEIESKVLTISPKLASSCIELKPVCGANLFGPV